MKFYFISETRKRRGNKKRLPVLVHSPKVWEHPSVPLPQENALILELPLYKITI
jgi:hypothetical protein